MFVTLFNTPTESHSNDIELLKCIIQTIDPIKFYGNGVDKTKEPEPVELDGINLETTRKFISKFAKTRYLTSLPVFHPTDVLDWLFEVLNKLVKYDLYDEFIENQFQGKFDFATLILWRSIVSRNVLSDFDFPGEPFSGYFFQDLKNKSFDQLPAKTIEVVKDKVTKAADLLTEISRPEIAKLLRQSIETE